MILDMAGVTVDNAVPRRPKQLFPKWQTIPHLAPMAAPAGVKRKIKQPPPIPDHLKRPIKVSKVISLPFVFPLTLNLNYYLICILQCITYRSDTSICLY